MTISDAALDDLKARMPCHQVAAKWVKLRKSGQAWVGPCPLCSRDPNKKTATKFKATEQRWMCAACMDGGDVIELVRKVEGKDFSSAVEWLGGVQEIDQAEADRRKAERDAKALEAEKAAAEFRERERGTLYEAWTRAKRPIEGTSVERYLALRGIDGGPVGALRCIEQMPYYDSGKKNAATVHRGPAMLAAFMRDGKFSGLHITWLDLAQPNGKLKLLGDAGEEFPAKKMRGSKSGALIKLAGPKEVTQVFVGEGIETVLSVWCALNDQAQLEEGDAFYVAGDLGNLGGRARESVPHPALKTEQGRTRRVPGPWPDDSDGIALTASVKRVVLLGDGDSDAFTTRCALARASARLALDGREVVVAMAPAGNDFNDIWRATRDAAAVCALIDAGTPLTPEDVMAATGRTVESPIFKGSRDPLKMVPKHPSPPRRNGNDGPPPDDEPKRQRNMRLAFFPLTDLGNAERLRERYRDQLRWCSALGWLNYDGKRWNRHNVEPIVKATEHHTVRAIQDEARVVRESGRRDEPDAPPGATDYVVKVDRDGKETLYSDKIAAWGRLSESANRLAAISKRAEAFFSIGVDALDADPMKINVRNGTLVICRDGGGDYVSFKPHNPNDLITKITPADYDPKATCPEYDKFLSRVQPDQAMRRFLHQWGGLSLTGDVSAQKLAFFYGKGGNGKSVLVDTWGFVGGDYGETVPIETFLDTGRSRGGGQATPDLAILPGVRMLRTSEPEKNSKLAKSLIKLLTGGEPIQARHLNRDYFSFYPQFKLTMSGNYRPSISGTDEGIRRRVLLVPFEVSIPKEERDPRLSAKLRAEGSGILNRMLDGLRDWIDSGLLEPDDVTRATDDYFSDNDPLGRFVAVCLEPADGARVQSSAMYEVYEAFSKASGEKVWTPRGFGLAMKERGYRSKQSNVRWWLNVRLTKSAADFDAAANEVKSPETSPADQFEDDEDVPL